MKMLFRFSLGLIVGIALSTSAIYGYHFIYDYAPSIAVHGELTDAEKVAVVEIVSGAVEGSGRWVSSLAIADSLLELPWVSDVSLKRSLDNKINVSVEVKNILARVDSETAVTEHGEVIHTMREPPSYLPTVQGSTNGEISTDIEPIKIVRAQFALAGEKISLFELTEKGWQVSLEAGHTIVLGDDDLVARADRFLRVYSTLDTSDTTKIVVADARYNSGVAVRIQPHDETPSDAPELTIGQFQRN